MMRSGVDPAGGWDAHRLTLAFGIAAGLPACAAIAERGGALSILLAMGLAVIWEAVFAWIRRRPMAWDGLVSGLIFALLVPAQTPFWQQGLALSFGLVMGDLIFGGRGRGFLSPACVGLAFLLFSFPQAGAEDLGLMTMIAALGGGAILLGLGLLSWRVVLGFCLPLLAGAALSGAPEAVAWMPNATLALGLIFLIGDPVAAASTNPGRWAYGGMAGALVMLFGSEGSALASVVFAGLLASLFAPLMDQAVVWWAWRRRRNRRGQHG